MPATEPLVPVVAPVVEPLVLQGNEPGWLTTGDPLMLGTPERDAAFGLPGLTAPGIGDCVEGARVAVPGIVLVPGAVEVLGAGTDGATPGGAEPGLSDGAVAVPVGPPERPAAPPDPNPPLDVLPAPDDPPPAPPDDDPPVCACADRLRAATSPAARASFREVCAITFSHQRIPQHTGNVSAHVLFLEVPLEKQPCVMTPPDREGPMDQTTSDASEIEYSYKPSLMGALWTFRLAPDALQWSIGSVSGQVAYADIRRVRMSFRPVTMQSYRFLTEIWADRIPKLSIVSSSWKSLTEQERQDDTYSRFVVALHEKIAAAHGSPRLQGGAVAFLYWPGAAIFGAICVATVGLLVRSLQEGETATTLLLAAFFAFLVWQLGRFFKRNLPRRYTLDAIPQDLLPTSGR